MILNRAKVEAIEPCGDDGFFKATLAIGNHLSCIEVIGANLTECVERTHAVLQAFNDPKS